MSLVCNCCIVNVIVEVMSRPSETSALLCFSYCIICCCYCYLFSTWFLFYHYPFSYCFDMCCLSRESRVLELTLYPHRVGVRLRIHHPLRSMLLLKLLLRLVSYLAIHFYGTLEAEVFIPHLFEQNVHMV